LKRFGPYTIRFCICNSKAADLLVTIVVVQRLRILSACAISLCFLLIASGHARADDQPIIPESAPVSAPSPDASATPPTDTPPAPTVRYFRYLRLVTDITLDYLFLYNKQTITLTYHIDTRQRFDLPATVDIPVHATLKGKAPVLVAANSALVQWNDGRCDLLVQVPDAPFELRYSEPRPGLGSVTLDSFGPVSEAWESQCSMLSDPTTRFDTSGPPEQWINHVFAKMKEQLKDFSIPAIDSIETSETFRVEAESVKDDNVGNIDLRAQGMILLEPIEQEPIAPGPPPPSADSKPPL